MRSASGVTKADPGFELENFAAWNVAIPQGQLSARLKWPTINAISERATGSAFRWSLRDSAIRPWR
jgi:hypothetical protein